MFAQCSGSTGTGLQVVSDNCGGSDYNKALTIGSKRENNCSIRTRPQITKNNNTLFGKHRQHFLGHYVQFCPAYPKLHHFAIQQQLMHFSTCYFRTAIPFRAGAKRAVQQNQFITVFSDFKGPNDVGAILSPTSVGLHIVARSIKSKSQDGYRADNHMERPRREQHKQLPF